MSSIIFVKLFVQDVEAMANFYRKVLRLKEKGRIRYPIARGVNEGIEVEEVTLVPVSGEAAGPTFILLQYLDNRPAVNGEVTIGLSTDNLAGVIERAQSEGGKITHPPEEFSVKTDEGSVISGELMVMADPEGHLTEIAQVMSTS